MTEMNIQGVGRSVHFDGKSITISRRGFIVNSANGRGEKRIPVGPSRRSGGSLLRGVGAKQDASSSRLLVASKASHPRRGTRTVCVSSVSSSPLSRRYGGVSRSRSAPSG